MRLDLVVGPNGAGKTTFVERVIAPVWPNAVFVNADEIAKQRWPDDQAAHGYEAARVAADTRAKLIALGRPFVAETVFSHPAKLQLITDARNHGYHVSLHVVMVPEDLSVERVAARVDAGGHHVPVDKIRERHRRLWVNVADAIDLVDAATCWDNSSWDGPTEVGLWVAGTCIGRPAWPAWVPDDLSSRWPGR